MIKSVLAFSILFTSTIFSFGQLKVFPTGNVVVGSTAPSSWVLTADGYAGFLTRYEGTYVRLNSHPSNGCIGSNTDKFVFWTPPTGHNEVWFQKYHKVSDSTRKENILPINNGLSIVMDLYPIKFDFKVDSLNLSGGTGYGFSAQDVQILIPEIVDTSQGVLGMRTDEIIPFLVDAVQTQQAQIDSLRNRIVELEKCDCKIKNKNKYGELDSGVVEVYEDDKQQSFYELGQNNPNPFKESTTITYSVPVDSKSALIIIYDLSGRELESYSLTTFGHGQLLIEGNSFKPGMYVYALIVDGEFMDSKKMILSK